MSQLPSISMEELTFLFFCRTVPDCVGVSGLHKTASASAFYRGSLGDVSHPSHYPFTAAGEIFEAAMLTYFGSVIPARFTPSAPGLPLGSFCATLHCIFLLRQTESIHCGLPSGICFAVTARVSHKITSATGRRNEYGICRPRPKRTTRSGLPTPSPSH
jgi:hypothetical protein